MVVLLQYLVTQQTKKKPMVPMMALGAAFYMVGTTAVSIFSGFWGFWACMVVHTIGELILVPTATTYAANLAPSDMRGRYMSIYGLTWNVASGIAPLVGGYLSDHFGAVTPWYGSGFIGLLSLMVYLRLYIRSRKSTEEPAVIGS